jgi:hypothetical protein
MRDMIIQNMMCNNAVHAVLVVHGVISMTVMRIMQAMITRNMIMRAMHMIMEIPRTSALMFEDFFRFDMPLMTA